MGFLDHVNYGRRNVMPKQKEIMLYEHVMNSKFGNWLANNNSLEKS